MRFLLPAALAVALLTGASCSQTAQAQQSRLEVPKNLPPEVKRQMAAVDARKADLDVISGSLAFVDSAVVCNIRDTKWAETYRPRVWRMYDGITAEIGLSGAAKYALAQDLEHQAHTLTVRFNCDKLTVATTDQFAALFTEP